MVAVSIIISVAVHAFAFAAILASLFYVGRQVLGKGPVRVAVAAIHMLFLALTVLDMYRVFYARLQIIGAMASVFVTLVLASAALVGVVSYYVRAGGEEVVRPWPRRLSLAFYIGYLAETAVYLVGYAPYTTFIEADFSGLPVASVGYSGFALLLLVGGLILFLAFPVTTLVRTAGRIANPRLKRTLRTLGLGWAFVAMSLLLLNGFMMMYFSAARLTGFVILGGIFLLTAFINRGPTGLESVLAPPARRSNPSHPFASRLGEPDLSLANLSILLEFDTSCAYEGAVADFATELSSDGDLVFAVTRHAAPVYSALASVPDVRYFLLSSSVSYPAESGEPNRILVPASDSSMLLDTLDKVMAVNPRLSKAVIYDSLSDLLGDRGLVPAYKTVKRILELLDGRNVTLLFLMARGAHSGNEVAMLRALFSKQLLLDQSGLKKVRW